MKRLLLIFIPLLSLITGKVDAQGSFSSSSHTIKANYDTLFVYQRSYFRNGSPSACPPVDSVKFDVHNDTIILFVRYNEIGAWPLQGCVNLDTIRYKLENSGLFTLIVNSYVYNYNISEEDYKTVQVDSDTSYAVKVDVREIETGKQNGVTLYPNPANHQVQIKTNTHISITAVTLFDVLGKQLSQFTGGNTLLNLTGLPAGNYFLKISTEQEVLVEKLLIE